jgi:hypothetical protein
MSESLRFTGRASKVILGPDSALVLLLLMLFMEDEKERAFAGDMKIKG